jgi:RNA polymerase sigma-70 factor (ECF subfamily)
MTLRKAALTEPGSMDNQTVLRFIETRDPELFREIVEEFQHRVYRLVASVLGPWSDLDAEEVTQEVFLRAYRKIGQFRGESTFGSWLHRVAYTTALNHRQLARIRLPHEGEESILALESIGDQHEELLESVTRARVASMLEELPVLYRTVVYLYYWQDCGIAEISESIGAPPGTVKSYLHRARERLRNKLERDMADAGIGDEG